MLMEMTGFGVEDGKKTKEEVKAEEEEGKEEKISNNNDDWGHYMACYTRVITHC